ncbi:hypothetical protein GCM10009716_00030 [Streptomyces sodiiphilus]|uniref:Uncharacterized protein n=1 Tax=Streptomyces sodiiphilus TaxID=226217 RepID=A0ABN2NQ23_9ACTN
MGVEVWMIVFPAVIGLAGLFLRSRAGSSNLWDVLHELARGRARVGLEREQRVTLEVMLERLPKAGLRMEDAQQGRRTVIAADRSVDDCR